MQHDRPAARIGSLCTGYGGLDEGVRSVLGGELAWVADNDPGAAAILAHRFPSVKNLGDITIADWGGVESVDVLTAGFPCQDVSAAGKRAGLRRGNRSGVWIEVSRAIAALRPGLVVIENVRGLLTARGDEPTDEHLRAEAARDAAMRLEWCMEQWLGSELNIAVSKGDADRARRIQVRAARVVGVRKRAVARCLWHERRLVRAIGTVLGSLADLGYDAEWVCVGADDAGACHERKRVFILAWPAADAAGPVGGRLRGGGSGLRGAGVPAQSGDGGLPAADTAGPRHGGSEDAGASGGDAGTRARSIEPERARRAPALEDADRAAGGERRLAAPGQAAGGRSRADAGGSGGVRAVADACGAGLEVGAVEPDRHERQAAERGRGDAPADTYGQDAGSQRGGGAAAAPTGPGDGQERRREPGPGVGGGTPADAEYGAESEWSRDTWRETRERASVGVRPECDNGSPVRPGIEWGAYEPAIRRWEAVTGRHAPPPTEPGRTGQRLSPAFVEWLMGLPEGWVTGVPGLSRNQMLKALGNGVVPAQAAMALRILLDRADFRRGAA